MGGRRSVHHRPRTTAAAQPRDGLAVYYGMTRRWIAATALIAPLLLAACNRDAEQDSPTVPPLLTGTGSTAGATNATTAPAGTKALPVYYVAETAAGFRLYREFHSVPTSDPASDAVREMLSTPATDPDYRSSWPAGTTLHAPVTHDGGVITVDLSGQARSAQVGAELAERTVQQLVYTVQGALQSTDPVRILIDGQPAADLWGHVDTSQPVRRADAASIRSLVQIDNPAHGTRVGRTFTVSGEALAFEANVPWQVLRGGTVVQSGNATAAEGQKFSAYSFSLTLEPGDYTLRVVEDDPSGGEGRPPFEDTKAVTVTG
jgi:Sporulation and spore germination/Immunoglobulin-like domain of bacterial spore germination